MPIELRSRTYSDLNPNPRIESAVLNDEDAIYRALENYFNTSRSERLFRPEEGGSVEDWLFELAVDDENAFMILSRIASDLPNAEPRISLVTSKSKVVADPDNYRYVLYLTFNLVGLEGDFVFDGYLIRKTR
ncbi:putative baseplate wedge subunit [Vibrio phage 150E35-1]|nr:putative baseplate wedge subunit [Vibrio phage 150E35-1]